MDYKNYFKNKKITVMGLGLLGRGVGDVEFLAFCGARLTVTDLKSKKELASSLAQLKKFKNIEYVLGRHLLKDFRACDMVIKAAGVSLTSVYIAEAKKHNIRIEMSASFVAKLSGATIIGITGTRGKSTVTHLIYNILKQAGKRVFLGGNIRGMATLQLLRRVKRGDIVVMELDSWQLQGFGDSKISPHISVFTTFLPDHMDYYGGSMARYWHDKGHIFKYQVKGDYLITGKAVAKKIRKESKKPASKLIVADRVTLGEGIRLHILGEHNRDNAALAAAAATMLGIKQRIIKKTIEDFRGIEGRLQYIKTVRGVKIYNDNYSTTPDATIVALKSLTVRTAEQRRIVLILGGSDKGLDVSELMREIPRCCKAVVLLEGIDTNILRIKNQGLKVKRVRNLRSAISEAVRFSKRGDIVLFSPAFASFGLFKNEFDRGDQFVNLVKRLR
ncbi:UDP-N-acetylmuramoyl-L-alanine--D-glutamate ligase [Patescibacteria group bacterium]|nr:UDP-N-acetylmuramoyl-L-alanine--D-glutamate ligase [Patescibacteria group bacterium]